MTDYIKDKSSWGLIYHFVLLYFDSLKDLVWSLVLFHYPILDKLHHLFSLLWRNLLAVEVGGQPWNLLWLLLLRTVHYIRSLRSEHWLPLLLRPFLEYFRQISLPLISLVLFLALHPPADGLLNNFCDILYWNLTFYVLLNMTIFFICVFPHQWCELLLIISKLSWVKVVLLEVWNERAFRVFGQDIWTIDFSDPRMKNNFFHSNVGT